VTNDRTGADESALVDQVDQHPDTHRATEPDEGDELRRMYGEPGPEGFYRGDGEEVAG